MRHTTSSIRFDSDGYKGIVKTQPSGFSSGTNRTLHETDSYPNRDQAVRAVNNFLSRPDNRDVINQWIN